MKPTNETTNRQPLTVQELQADKRINLLMEVLLPFIIFGFCIIAVSAVMNGQYTPVIMSREGTIFFLSLFGGLFLGFSISGLRRKNNG